MSKIIYLNYFYSDELSRRLQIEFDMIKPHIRGTTQALPLADIVFIYEKVVVNNLDLDTRSDSVMYFIENIHYIPLYYYLAVDDVNYSWYALTGVILNGTTVSWRNVLAQCLESPFIRYTGGLNNI